MELLSCFSQGDVEAFETLFRKHQREIYGYIVRIVRDPGIAEDYFRSGGEKPWIVPCGIKGRRLGVL
jgi:hypothetical protein